MNNEVKRTMNKISSFNFIYLFIFFKKIIFFFKKKKKKKKKIQKMKNLVRKFKTKISLPRTASSVGRA